MFKQGKHKNEDGGGGTYIRDAGKTEMTRLGY